MNLACQSTIRNGRLEVPKTSVIGRPGAAFLRRTSRLNRKPAFPRLYYFDANHEQTLRDRTTQIGGFVMESTEASRTTDRDGSDTEWESAHVTVTHLPPAAEADEDLADYNVGDAPTAGAPPAVAQDECQ